MFFKSINNSIQSNFHCTHLSNFFIHFSAGVKPRKRQFTVVNSDSEEATHSPQEKKRTIISSKEKLINIGFYTKRCVAPLFIAISNYFNFSSGILSQNLFRFEFFLNRHLDLDYSSISI